MTDYSDLEINAVSAVFPEARVLLCDFHRLQAWWRWIRLGVHGVPVNRQKELFALMCAIADAQTEEQFELCVRALRGHDLYTQAGSQVPAYLERHWLAEDVVPMWAACYRQVYHGGINTNNYMECMNRVVKARFLAKRIDQRLDSLVEAFVMQVVPYYLRSYVLQNLVSIKAGTMLRDPAWPDWAQGRPQPVVHALLQRLARAKELPPPAPGLLPGQYAVNMSTATIKLLFKDARLQGRTTANDMAAFIAEAEEHDLVYHVNIPEGTCTCADRLHQRMPCKHIMAVLHHHGVAFSQLPASLTQQPRLLIDFEACGCEPAAPPARAQELRAMAADIQVQTDIDPLEAENIEMDSDDGDCEPVPLEEAVVPAAEPVTPTRQAMLREHLSNLQKLTTRAYGYSDAQLRVVLEMVQAVVAADDAMDHTLHAFVGLQDLPTITTPPPCRQVATQRRLATPPTPPELPEFECSQQRGRPKGDGRAFPNTQELMTDMEAQLKAALRAVQGMGTPAAVVDTHTPAATPLAPAARQVGLVFGPALSTAQFLQLQALLLPAQASNGAAALGAKQINDAVLQYYTSNAALPLYLWHILAQLGVRAAV